MGKFSETIMIFLLVGLLIYLGHLLYQYAPGEQQNFSLDLKKENIVVNASAEIVQFVPNMRFAKNELNYYIYPDCDLKKISDMRSAFEILSSKTGVLNFQDSTKERADIIILCSPNEKETKKNEFIAGEGGPSEYLNLSLYPLIISGEILLYDTRGENCDYPVVELHELLHVFGFDHISDENSILYPYYSCDQRLDRKIISEIQRIYSVSPLAELYFVNATASKSGSYLNFDVQVQNRGLVDAKKVEIQVYSSGEFLETFDLGDISPGTTQILNIKNLMLPSRKTEQIELKITSDSEEYSLDDNVIVAQI